MFRNFNIFVLLDEMAILSIFRHYALTCSGLFHESLGLGGGGGGGGGGSNPGSPNTFDTFAYRTAGKS